MDLSVETEDPGVEECFEAVEKTTSRCSNLPRFRDSQLLIDLGLDFKR